MTSTLSRSDTLVYLSRIKLPPSLLSSPPSHSLLSTLILAHLEQVPKDTTPLHVPAENWTMSTPIKLGGSSSGMPFGVAAFSRVIDQNAGAFCFGLNPTFASLLRAFKFRVSEVAATSILLEARGRDPRVSPEGWMWGAMTHIALIVDWNGSEGRYLADVVCTFENSKVQSLTTANTGLWWWWMCCPVRYF